MKLTAFIALLPLVVIATPITSPDPAVEAVSNLLPRANRCYLNSDALRNDPQGCDTSPTSGVRVRGVTGGDRFTVSCTRNGRNIGGNRKWDYVPAWGCWIWSGWTQQDCEGKWARLAETRGCTDANSWSADVLILLSGSPYSDEYGRYLVDQNSMGAFVTL
jgi:hypothetical protein